MSETYDIVIYGATGFTGKQTAERLAPHADRLRIALAGRNPRKLDLLRMHLPNANALGVIVADAQDAEAIDAMVRSTRLVVSTAGPFALYSDKVVEACVEHGVDYLDITGETTWVRSLIDRFHDRAVASGTRIIPLCGIDSVPSDLGAYLIVEHIRDTLEQGTRSIRGYVSAKGGFNGGTLASGFELYKDPEAVAAFGDPILLNPPEARDEERRHHALPDQHQAVYRPEVDGWTVAYIMAPINTRVVRRSAALAEAAEAPYGDSFQYHESMLLPRRLGQMGATLVAGALNLTERLMANSIARKLLKRLAPKPGTGPSEKTMNEGFFKMRFFAEADDGTVVKAVFACEGDPGNRITTLLLAQAALMVAEARDDLPPGGGVLTPALGLGLGYAERLREAGVELSIMD